MVVEGELFGGLDAVFTDAEDFNAFEVQRAELGGLMLWDARHVGGEVRLEAVRSAGSGSLLGIDGDSLVMRLKRAWGYASVPLAPVRIDLRLGLVPDVWIEAVQSSFELRGLGPTLSESGGFFDTSDLGGSVRVDVLDGLATAQVAVTNGEGRNLREQNAGKNTTVTVTLRPWRLTLGGEEAGLWLHGVYRDGSTSVASVIDNRIGGAVAWTSAWVDAGVELVRANGYAGREVDATGLGAWANGYLVRPWLGAVVRYDHLNPDTKLADADRQTLTAGLYTDLVLPALPPDPRQFRLYLVVQDESAGAGAGPIPGRPEVADLTRLMLTLAVGGRWRSAPDDAPEHRRD